MNFNASRFLVAYDVHAFRQVKRTLRKAATSKDRFSFSFVFFHLLDSFSLFQLLISRLESTPYTQKHKSRTHTLADIIPRQRGKATLARRTMTRILRRRRGRRSAWSTAGSWSDFSLSLHQPSIPLHCVHGSDD